MSSYITDVLDCLTTGLDREIVFFINRTTLDHFYQLCQTWYIVQTYHKIMSVYSYMMKFRVDSQQARDSVQDILVIGQILSNFEPIVKLNKQTDNIPGNQGGMFKWMFK